MTSRKTVFPKHWVVAIFKKFKVYYGSKWVSSISDDEENYVTTWSKELTGFTSTEISVGLKLAVDLEWPPALGEFKKLCKSNKIQNSNKKDKYINSFQTFLKFETNTIVAKANSRMIKNKLNMKQINFDEETESEVKRYIDNFKPVVL